VYRKLQLSVHTKRTHESRGNPRLPSSDSAEDFRTPGGSRTRRLGPQLQALAIARRPPTKRWAGDRPSRIRRRGVPPKAANAAASWGRCLTIFSSLRACPVGEGKAPRARAGAAQRSGSDLDAGGAGQAADGSAAGAKRRVDGVAFAQWLCGSADRRRACQFHGRSSWVRLAGWPGWRARTSASQARGSMLCTHSVRTALW
jgi:hypothetical protein